MATQTLIAPTKPEIPPTLLREIDDPENTPEHVPLDGDLLLQQVNEFLARYLVCSEHQRNLMALWVLHTHCYYVAHVTPYLAIQSTRKQSGKSLCLHLLKMLSARPA